MFKTNSSAPSAYNPVVPEIAPADLQAVRRFLMSVRDEERRGPSANPLVGPIVRKGITRARYRSASKSPS